MYEEFYGFRDSPFRLTPDPNYLFLSSNHQEALGHLLFGVSEGNGVVVITGEIGTGKTTLLRTLVRNLDTQTTVAYIFNPALSALELLQTINTDLGLPATSTSKKALIDELNRFLLEQQAAGRRVVVIIDEAQDLEPGVLEQLRLLSNLETEREKLLHIVLVGQPELRSILARPDLAQLDQRVTLRWHLGPMNDEETAGYVRHRLRVAADGREPVRFTPGALRQVYRFSRGVPRVINVLCHRALLISYTHEERQISQAVIRQAAKELRSSEPEGRRLFSWRTLALATSLLVLLVGGLFFVAPPPGWLSALMPWKPAATQVAVVGTPQGESTESPSTEPANSSSPQAADLAPSATDPPQPEATPDLSGPATTEATAVMTEATSTPGTEDNFVTTDAFLQELQRSELIDSAVHATNGLLHAWGADSLRGGEWQNGALDLTTIARTRQLEYLPVNGTLNFLSLLDLPVIMELMTPARQEMRFVLLLGITNDRCRILLDREREVPIQAISENWFGKAHLFWKDFENLGFLLTVGSVGQNVRRLHTLLSKVQELHEAELSVAGQMTDKLTFLNRETFSKQTEQVVARFQKANRLAPDGVVGPLTMILLYKSLPGYSRPSLVIKQDGSGTIRETAERTRDRKGYPSQEGT
jgi:general secretion pathway protein A